MYIIKIILPVLNFAIFDQKYALKIFGMVKIIKAPPGFELITYVFVDNVLTQSA